MGKTSLDHLTKQRRSLIVAGGACVAGLVLLFVMYLPLSSHLKQAGREMKALQGELKTAKGVFDTYDTIEAKGKSAPLPVNGKREIFNVMDELTSIGKDLDIDFRSIRPGEAQKTTQGLSQFPIEMTLVCSYKSLGLFVGSLRELETGFAKVEKFMIERDGTILPRLRCQLWISVFSSH